MISSTPSWAARAGVRGPESLGSPSTPPHGHTAVQGSEGLEAFPGALGAGRPRLQSSGAGRSLWPRKGLGLAQGHAARTIFRLPQLLAFQGCMGGTRRGPSMGYASPWEALVLPVRQVFQDEAPSYYVRCVDRLGHLLRFSRSHTSSATAQRQGSASPAQPSSPTLLVLLTYPSLDSYSKAPSPLAAWPGAPRGCLGLFGSLT